MYIIAEQYRNLELQGWYSDNFNTAAIWIMDRTKLHITKAGKCDGFVWVKIENLTYISVYLSPNQGIAVFLQKLEEIEDFVRGVDGEVVSAGDFNAKALDWGMDYTCSRGSVVVEMISRLDLTVLNSGSAATFRRAVNQGTIIDITLATPISSANIHEWIVLEEFSCSDHQHIKFMIRLMPDQGVAINRRMTAQTWNVAKLDRAALLRSLPTVENLAQKMACQKISPANAEACIDETMQLIAGACNVSMPKKTWNFRRKPVYW